MLDVFQFLFGFFNKCVIFMWPLLVCSIVSLTVIILRTLALREKNVLPLTIESEMERLAPGANPERLFRIVQHDASSLARIVRVALAHLRWPRSENVETVQTRARYEMVRLEKGLVVLEVIIGIAPLIGLIGTVSGLVHVFASLGVSASSADPKLIARGISEALNCTVFGLGIAVPSLIGFVYFSKKVEVLSVEMESLVTDLLSKCYHGRLAGGRAKTQVPTQTVTPAEPATRKSRRWRDRRSTSVKFAVRKRRAPSIIIVSLVDILTILLIFFVVSTTFKKDQPEVQINLPESKTATNAPAELEHAIVSVDQNDEIKLDGRTIAVEELESAVKNLSDTRRGTLALQADKKASFGTIVKVMDALKLAGVKNLPAFTRGEP